MTVKKNRETIFLLLGGMTCAACARAVDAALQDVSGVEALSVNFASQTASVTGSADVSSLIRAVNDAGYDANLLQKESIESQEQKAGGALRDSLLRSSLALLGGCLLMMDMWLDFLPSFDETDVWIAIGSGAFACILIAGGHFFVRAIRAAKHFAATMDTLIALGTSAAWIYSMTVVLYPELLPTGSRHQFFEAALFIIGFVNLGKALEMNARSKASLAVQKLFDLTPSFVTLIDGEKELVVPIADLRPGQHLKIRPGENFPVDGVVLDGNSFSDESLLTGESSAVRLSKGSKISAGSLNVEGALLIQVVSVGEETRLAELRRLVNEAQNSKPRAGEIVDQITAVFVPTIMVIAALTFLSWCLVGPEPRLTYAFVTALSVLIIACPCALGLAVPMSMTVGIGRAATMGLLIKNSQVLQRASRIDVVMLDKTGTITIGKPEVSLVSGLSDEYLSIVLGMAQQTTHPLGKSIVDACFDRNIAPANLSLITEYPGGGLVADFHGQEFSLGSLSFLGGRGVLDLPYIDESGSIVALAQGSIFKGHFVLNDAVRTEATDSILSLRAMGITPVLLTGDRSEIAEAVAREVGITDVYAEVSPLEKLEMIKTFQSAGHRVAMVGDGINDAAALTAADVSFAMGLGADVAIESADVSLKNNSIRGVEETIQLADKVVTNVRQNLFAAFGYNILLIPVAAGVLFPYFGLLIDPSFAGLAMALSSLSVVFNAGRLRFA